MSNLDERTKKYFDAIKSNVGYLGSNAGWYGIEEILRKSNALDSSDLQSVHKYVGYVNSGDIEIFKYNSNGETKYCAELGYQTDIDDYCIETHIFSEYPSRDNVILIRKIDDIVFKMSYKGLKPEFSCWECGRLVHWLDVGNDFNSKVDMLEEKYCGC